MRIFLTGMMGTGKTAVAKALSELFGYDLIDLDEEIVKKYAMSIEDIFRDRGETAFRDYETETAKALDLPERSVIATGGGFPVKEANRSWMKENGTVVWLKCSPQAILERIKDEDRPLLPKPISVEHIKKILDSRIAIYEQADQAIDTDELTPVEIARKIEKVIG